MGAEPGPQPSVGGVGLYHSFTGERAYLRAHALHIMNKHGLIDMMDSMGGMYMHLSLAYMSVIK